MSIDADARAWLRERGAEAIEHPGGTLYAHLCRVQERIVNELDVMQQDPSVADRHGGYFRELFATWAPVTSPQVAGEARRALGR